MKKNAQIKSEYVTMKNYYLLLLRNNNNHNKTSKNPNETHYCSWCIFGEENGGN